VFFNLLTKSLSAMINANYSAFTGIIG